MHHDQKNVETPNKKTIKKGNRLTSDGMEPLSDEELELLKILDQEQTSLLAYKKGHPFKKSFRDF